MKKLLSYVLVLFSLTAVSNVNAKTNVSEVVDGMNAFAFDIYHKLSKPGQNAIFSPYSLSFLLEMLVSGSAGDTRVQLMHVLHLDRKTDLINLNTNLDQMNAALLANHDIAIGNALWADEKLTYKPAFLNGMEKISAVSFNRVNFAMAPAQAADKINAWVAMKTNGYIKKLFDAPFNAATMLVLTNAIYFKGLWALPFNASNTVQQTFTMANGSKIQVPMMHMTNNFNYADTDKLQMLQLNYSDSTLSIAIILPKEKHNLTEVQQSLDNDSFMKLIQFAALAKPKVILSLPKFKLASKFGAELIASLQVLGMADAFNTKSNFSNLIEPTSMPLYVSAIIQKAIIEVDEKGTVAVAATGMTMFGRAAMINAPEPIRFTADHPFLFIIFDTKSGVILFIGQTDQP